MSGAVHSILGAIEDVLHYDFGPVLKTDSIDSFTHQMMSVDSPISINEISDYFIKKPFSLFNFQRCAPHT